MKASLPNGYTVDRRTLFQLFQDGVITHPKFYKDSVATSPKSLVIITKEMIGEGTRDYILQLADEGNTVMVATTYLNEWADTLGLDFRWNNSFILSEVAGNNLEKDTLKWVSDMPKDSVYAQVPLWQSVYPQMIERTLLLPDSVPHDNLLIYNGTREGDSVCEPVAVSFSIGRGELIIVSSPLLLTNYMTLDGNGSALQGRLMNRLKANPVIRTEAYMSVTAQEESSPFYVSYFVPFGTGYAPLLMGKVVDMFYFPLIETEWPLWMPFVGGEHFVFFSPVFNFADASISVSVVLLLLFYRKEISRISLSSAAEHKEEEQS
jgi:hypothetical protein